MDVINFEHEAAAIATTNAMGDNNAHTNTHTNRIKWMLKQQIYKNKQQLQQQGENKT